MGFTARRGLVIRHLHLGKTVFSRVERDRGRFDPLRGFGGAGVCRARNGSRRACIAPDCCCTWRCTCCSARRDSRRRDDSGRTGQLLEVDVRVANDLDGEPGRHRREHPNLASVADRDLQREGLRALGKRHLRP